MPIKTKKRIHPIGFFALFVLYVFVLLFPFLNITLHQTLDSVFTTLSVITWGVSSLMLGVVFFVVLRKYQR